MIVLTGCHKAETFPKANPRAFDQAEPELKQMWEGAQAADQTNNYADAQTLYFTLMRQNLTPDERTSVNAASTLLNDRLTKAVQAGDPGAKEALAEMRTNPPNRIR